MHFALFEGRSRRVSPQVIPAVPNIDLEPELILPLVLPQKHGAVMVLGEKLHSKR